MVKNIELLEQALNKKGILIDKDYGETIEKLVIGNEPNELIETHDKLLHDLTIIQAKLKHGMNIENVRIRPYVNNIVKYLKVKGMNYSPFVQYFNVHNITHSIFNKMNIMNQIETLNYIIVKYLQDRHDLYKQYGYSNVVLQVMADNYSHKRKVMQGVNALSKLFETYGIPEYRESLENKDIYYMKADKRGRKDFIKFMAEHKIKLNKRGFETIKYPDVLLKIKDQYFIIEEKNMKESGGGQNKQTMEITEFISRKPEFEGLHYVTCITGRYFNYLSKDAIGKKLTQYHDIVKKLQLQESNYFVNTYGLKYLITETLNDKLK